MSLRSELVALAATIPAFVDDAGPRVYADIAPDGAVPPYAVIYIDIAEDSSLAGDSKTRATNRMSQLSVFESRSDESELLHDAIWNTFDGHRLSDGWALRLKAAPRLADELFDLVHRPYTILKVQLR